MTIQTKDQKPIDINEYQNLIEFVANKPQSQAYVVMPNEMYAFIARGGGKTLGIIVPWILHKVATMPRSSGGLVGRTFSDIENKILKPILQGFSEMGLEDGLDYCYGKRPPDSWDKPLTPVIDYKHTLSFPNGTNMQLISLHLKGSANGLSLQWIVCDEAKFIDEVQLRAEVFPILRGHLRHFGHLPWYGAKLFVTDKLSPNMDWLLDKRKLVDHQAVNAVIHFQLKINSLQLLLANASNSVVRKILNRIKRYELILNELRANLVYVVEASALENIKNLGANYFENQKRLLTPYEYWVQILNNDPTKVENCFYPNRTKKHVHNLLDDEDMNQPLGIVMDYQASISPLVAFQVNSLVLGFDSLNFIRGVYVKEPLGLKEAVDLFCEHYKDRPCKRVYYFYDHTAIARKNGESKFNDRVYKYFTDNGWQVDKIYMGKAPDKDVQYDEMKTAFQNTETTPLQVRFNGEGCAILLMSMDRSETRTNRKGKTVKYKYYETVQTYKQELATHFSDCFDQAFHAVVNMKLYPSSSSVSVGVNGFRKK